MYKNLYINEVECFKKHFNPVESRDFVKKIQLWGATLVGFGDVSEGLAKEFRHLPMAISLAIKHPSIKESLIKKGSTKAYSSHFAFIDTQLENCQKRISSYLRFHGWKAFVIPPDTDRYNPRFAAKLFPLFQHKTAATCAGLGWIGKNGLLVTKEYGASLSWATVLTNASLETFKAPYRLGQCGECDRCKTACPANAISNEEWVRGKSNQPKINVDACAKQLENNYQVLGSYICGLCIMACPLNNC